jgi:hypothetical protein
MTFNGRQAKKTAALTKNLGWSGVGAAGGMVNVMIVGVADVMVNHATFVNMDDCRTLAEAILISHYRA